MITSNHVPVSGMSQLAHALGPLGYRRINVARSPWNDPHISTGFDTSIDSSQWMDGMPDEVRERYAWEWQEVIRQTTGGASTRAKDQFRGEFVARNAVQQIEAAVGDNEPFFCWVDVTEPHPPFYPPRELYEAIDRQRIQLPAEAEVGPGPHRSIAGRRSKFAH